MSTIAELMSSDPLNFTKTDIKSIIEHYREKRANFNAAALTGPKGKVKKEEPVATDVQKAAEALAASDQFDLGEL